MKKLTEQQYSKICTCQYDGTAYSGWQYQTNGNSIQQVIEDALFKFYKEPIKILASSRTDAGVHAFGQVFHYRTSLYRDHHSILMALNSILPADISISSVRDSYDGFHPIASAKNKTYCYKILNSPNRNAIYNNRAWHCREYIDIHDLYNILMPLKGTHDFSSFCMARSLKENNVRSINFINIDRSGDMIDVHINANGFLHNMIRIIVGTAVYLLSNNGSHSDMIEILNNKRRCNANKTAPACGLYLMEVVY